MFRLTYMLNGEPRSFQLQGTRITIGRMGGNDLVLPDHTVSRNHAELTHTTDGWKVVDLGSRNGTRVNDVFIREAHVSSGSTITLGRFILHMEEEPSKEVRIGPSSEGEAMGEGTIIRSVEEVNQLLAADSARRKVELAPADVDSLTRTSRILAVLSEVSKALLSASNDVESILEKIMDVIFQYVQAQRGAILLMNAKGELEPKIVRQVGDRRDPIQISQTIARKAVEEGLAILTQDAQVDPRFEAGESIRFLGIQAALCVPLKLEDTVLGLIYVDNPVKVRAYDDFDLDLLTALSGYAAIGIQQARLRAAIEEERLAKSRLERYHSPSVVNQILTVGTGGEAFALDVREAEATILFSDIVGFTTLTENMAPRDVALMLNAYFSRMTDVLFSHEGTLDKFIGDALMAIFGAPIHSEDHARRAVLSALDMRRALSQFNEDHPETPPLKFRIGINTGPVVAGDIGSIRRMEYSVLGTTVNVASRLQSEVAKPGEIVIGEATYKRIAGDFEFDPLGKVKVKGLSRPILAFAVRDGI
jgi:adenylate cyclase